MEAFERIDKSAKEFNNTLLELASVLDADVEKVVRLAVLKVFANIIKRSPVRTGAYRASHAITNSEPGETEGIEKGKVSGDEASAWFHSQAAGEAEAVRRGEAWRWTIEDGTIYIFNNVPYALELEEGHSMQAPAGIYAMALSEFTQIWEQELGKFGRLK